MVGRIAAVHNRLHNETHQDRVGFWGWFESVDDQAVADALFAEAAAWLRPRGLDTLRGPASFSVNDQCGLLVDGFDTPPSFMMPHNPRYYVPLVERAGFTVAKNLLVYEGGRLDPGPVPLLDRLARGADIVHRRNPGLTIRPLEVKQIRRDVGLIKSIYSAAWEKNWGFIPMTDHEWDHLAAQFKPVVVPELVPFLLKDGEPIGFAVALPDFNSVLHGNRNGGTLGGVARILWALNRRTLWRLRILLLGLLPEYRGRGLDVLLYHWIWSKGQALGYRWGEAGWILEDNAAMNAGLEKMTFRVYKTYRFYDRPL